jgi:uncharacterized caspase-like protein
MKRLYTSSGRGAFMEAKVNLIKPAIVFVVLTFLISACATAKKPALQITKPQEDRGITVQRMREKAVSRKVGRWAVVVGISDYKFDTRWHPQKGIMDLQYAHNDARSFADFLKSPAGGAFPPDRVLLLTNRKATVREVRKAIGDFLAQSLEDDLVIIFFAGHGSPDPKNPKNLYLLCHDTEPGNYYGTAFPMWEIDTALSRAIRSQRVIVLADACHSAGVGGTRSASMSKNFNEYMTKLAGSKEGLTKITASRADEFSQEKRFPEGGHGMFTYYLLKGLKGEADENKDGFVTMKESFDYLYDRVRSESRHSQNPWTSAYVSADIPIGILDKQVIQEIESRVEAEKEKYQPLAKPYQPAMFSIDLPKNSGTALKLAQAKLAKDERDLSLEMTNAVIARNDSTKPDALALKIKILLGYNDLMAAEDMEDILVIPYPDHPASKKGAKLIYNYYLNQVETAGPEEKIEKLSSYLKRHQGGSLMGEAKDRVSGLQAGLKDHYQKTFNEQSALAKGYMYQKRFDRAQDALYQAETILQKANNALGLGISAGNLSDLRDRHQVEAEKHRDFLAWNRTDSEAKPIQLNDIEDYNRRITIYEDFTAKWPNNPYASKAKRKINDLTSQLVSFKNRKFHDYFGKARDYFIRNDYSRAYESLEKSKKYGTPTQQEEIVALSRRYNAPPEVRIELSKEIVEWEKQIRFGFMANDREGDPVRVVSWDFGDGHTSFEENPERAYGKWQGAEKQRSYQIILKATDGKTTVLAKKIITVKRQDCIARDGRFCKYANSIVKDTNTGLEWFVGPDRDTTWDEARSWVGNLTVAGSGWRMPTIKELKTLYQKGSGTLNMTRLLETTGWRVHAAYIKGASFIHHFHFKRGSDCWYVRTYSGFRVFAVRSRR